MAVLIEEHPHDVLQLEVLRDAFDHVAPVNPPGMSAVTQLRASLAVLAAVISWLRLPAGRLPSSGCYHL